MNKDHSIPSREQLGLTKIEAVRVALLWFQNADKFHVHMGPDDEWYLKSKGVPKSFFGLAERLGLVRFVDISRNGTDMWYEPTVKGRVWLERRS